MSETNTFDLRVESRFKNALLYNALFERVGKPIVKNTALITGLPRGTITRLLLLQTGPRFNNTRHNRMGLYKPAVLTLSDFLEQHPEDLFPDSLYALNLPNVVVREYRSPEVISLQEAARARLLPSAEFDEDPGGRERAIAQALLTLSPVEEKVIRMRFGMIEGGHEHTLREVGEEFDRSRENMRRYETRALRKLRSPEIAKTLIDYAEPRSLR